MYVRDEAYETDMKQEWNGNEMKMKSKAQTNVQNRNNSWGKKSLGGFLSFF